MLGSQCILAFFLMLNQTWGNLMSTLKVLNNVGKQIHIETILVVSSSAYMNVLKSIIRYKIYLSYFL